MRSLYFSVLLPLFNGANEIVPTIETSNAVTPTSSYLPFFPRLPLHLTVLGYVYDQQIFIDSRLDKDTLTAQK